MRLTAKQTGVVIPPLICRWQVKHGRNGMKRAGCATGFSSLPPSLAPWAGAPCLHRRGRGTTWVEEDLFPMLLHSVWIELSEMEGKGSGFAPASSTHVAPRPRRCKHRGAPVQGARLAGEERETCRTNSLRLSSSDRDPSACSLGTKRSAVEGPAVCPTMPC